MFHEGSLQSGIALAIQEKKLVACFVRDDGEESTAWESEWLQSGWVSSLLAQKAVLLRIEAGSTEAGFLSAFCPISTPPAFVVIENGQLREQLVSGIGQDEFINRVRVVLGASAIPTTQSAGASQRTPPTEPAQASTPSRQATAPPAVEQSRREAPATAPSAKAKGKQKATPPEPKPAASTLTNAKQSAQDALRKKKQEDKDELARIQARIQADKAERKAQAEARKAEREQAAQSSPIPQTQSFTSTSNSRWQAKEVHLNVRLFDGRRIQSTFKRTAKLQEEVRSWVDQEFTAKAESPNETHPPYFFRQILAPLPSRELSAGEESETLGDIDLAPSATLVLVPVKGYTEAYAGGSSGVVGGVVGGVTGLVGGAFGLASSAVGLVGNALGSVVGYGRAAAGAANEQQPEQRPPAGRTLSEAQQPGPDDSGAGIRVRTIADQRAREPRSQQLYNGNQLNFEPRDEDANRR
ncbi:hypothetical protein BDV95DRAFT_138492 [Massariosphaeria phaeospora]|uniref:UBX domain-containing protein n=1 Tax=Massariosphaeria phaeospora TaxID=100035 RepID=A0A7C8MGP6_9PLEO|nr:hypothetical protein BDV95DRAFT_138492 [Massariosphaeria phaeospora]